MTVSGKTHVYFNGMLYQISSSGTSSRQLLWPVLLRGTSSRTGKIFYLIFSQFLNMFEVLSPNMV
ncbi:hypothetical protein HanPSC8_Chr09g0395581 [Helianthus annuus]|nr:hypothetical protein HanPSC8_Chr09g0395581 [Helianthus annuus]